MGWITISGGGGGGDVTAASTFGTDNVLIRADGTSKGVQSTGILVADTTDDLTMPADAQIIWDDGDATNPGLAISGDTNSGIFGATGTGDVVAITTGGTEAVRWNSVQDMVVAQDGAGIVFNGGTDNLQLNANSGGLRVRNAADSAYQDTFVKHLQVDGGSISNLTITSYNDSNTGVFYPAADSLAVACGGVAGFRVSEGVSAAGHVDSIRMCEQSGAYLHIQTSEELLSGLSGASASTTNLVPAGSRILHITCRVTTTITGATSFDVGDGSDVDRYGAAIALTSGTTTGHADYTADPESFNTAAQDVTLTANGSNFTAGAVRVVAIYQNVSAPTE